MAECLEEARMLAEVIDQKPVQEFYDSFCSIWQEMKENVLDGMSDADMKSYVGGVILGSIIQKKAMKQRFTRQKLRAKCAAVVVDSLSDYPLTQAWSVAMLMLFATQSNMCLEGSFVDWILPLIDRHYDMLTSLYEERQAVRAHTYIKFFAAIPEEKYTSACARLAIRFFSSRLLTKYLIKDDGMELLNDIRIIATRVLNTYLRTPGEYLTLTKLQSTKLVYYFSDEQKALFDVFMNGTRPELFDILANSAYVKNNSLDPHLIRFKKGIIEVLKGKNRCMLSDFVKQMEFDEANGRKFIMDINKKGAGIELYEKWSGCEVGIDAALPELEPCALSLDIE